MTKGIAANTDVSGNVCRDITTLGLNDRESSQGSTTELVAHLCSTLQETGVEVEDITGVCLTTGGTTEQEGHLAISDCLLGQVIVDDEGYAMMSAGLHHTSFIYSPCLPLSRNHSPMAQPEKGARYCKGAASDAVAATIMVYFMASFSSRVLTSWATVERFWPTAT